MLIDWFTVGAQALNFLILAWLLKRLLYRPILDAIDARQQRIAAELAAAGASVAAAQHERDEFRQRSEQIEAQRSALLAQASREALAEGQRLLEQARQAAEVLANRRRAALLDETEALNRAIRDGVQREVFAIARQALKDLAAESLEACMVAVFIRRLEQLDEQALAALVNELRALPEPAALRSAFELQAPQRSALQQGLDARCGAPVRLRFETSPELISGIELVTSGQKLGWSIAEYLRALERETHAVLAAQAGPEPVDRHAA